MTDIAARSPGDPPSLLEMLRGALADHRAGRTREAGTRYRQILTVDPGVADAFHLLGLLSSTDRVTESIALIRRAIAIDPSAVLYEFNLGATYSSANETEQAAICFERALERAPDYESAARALGVARAKLSLHSNAVSRSWRRWATGDLASYHARDEHRRRDTGSGHLLIRGWGCGFWGEVNHVAVQLALADITGREPIVYWGSEFRYRAPAIENAWEAYFEPLAHTTIGDLEHVGGAYFPGHWTRANLRESRVQPAAFNRFGVSALSALNRMDPVVVADGFNEISDVLAWAAPSHPYASMSVEEVARQVFARIRLNPDMRRRIDESAARHLGRRPVMAVHCRAQSHVKDAESLERAALSAEDYLPLIDAFAAAFSDSAVFLLTDLQPVADLFAARYGSRLIVLPRQRLARGEQVDLGLDPARDGHALGLEVLEDVYLALACDYFLGDGASGVSCSIAALKPWPEDRIRLLRRNVFLDRRAADYPR